MGTSVEKIIANPNIRPLTSCGQKVWWIVKILFNDCRKCTLPLTHLKIHLSSPEHTNPVVLATFWITSGSSLPWISEWCQNVYLSRSFWLWVKSRSHPCQILWAREMRTHQNVFTTLPFCWMAICSIIHHVCDRISCRHSWKRTPEVLQKVARAEVSGFPQEDIFWEKLVAMIFTVIEFLI